MIWTLISTCRWLETCLTSKYILVLNVSEMQVKGASSLSRFLCVGAIHLQANKQTSQQAEQECGHGRVGKKVYGQAERENKLFISIGHSGLLPPCCIFLTFKNQILLLF